MTFPSNAAKATVTELISYSELKSRLLCIPDPLHQSLLCSIYAGMARVGEIVKGRYANTQGLCVENVISKPNSLVLFIKTEKTHKVRKVPIFRNREQWLIEPIELRVKIVKTGPMFPYSTRWAEKVFKKYFPELKKDFSCPDGSKHTIHWLRGWRYSHYRRGEVTGKVVDPKVASLLGGWVSPNLPSQLYDFTQVDDFEAELENK